MAHIDLGKFSARLESEINDLEAEIKHAVKKEWYDKAAKLAQNKEGIRQANMLVNSGDFHVPTSSK